MSDVKKMAEHKQNKGLMIALIAFFCVFIAGFFAAILIAPKKDFSELENRYLQELPSFSMSGLISGSYTSAVEKYLNDHFPARDLLITANTAYERGTGKRGQGDVYFAADNTLLQRFNGTYNDFTAGNTRAIALLIERTDVPVYTAIAPSSADIWSEKLPMGAPTENQQALLERIYGDTGEGCVDVRAALLAHKDEYIYYKTDHHWTTLGAYYAYEAIIKKMGFEPVPLADYEKTVLNSDFYGTLYSKAPAYWVAADEISAYVPDEGFEVIAYDGSSYTQKTLYSHENLEKKDKYTVFLGGNQPVITISSTEGRADMPKLLIMRDSYADSMAPFLTAHFSEIHLLDLRYYRGSISNYIAENGIDFVLNCYNINQYAEIINIAAVLNLDLVR